MGKKLTQAQDILLEKINNVCKKYGLNNIMAQLYAILYTSNKMLSLDEMVDRLKISKGSVSINIRNLERYGAARRIWVKGSRKDYYEAETDLYKVISQRVKSMAEKRLSEADDMIKSALEVVDSIQPQDGEEKEKVAVFKQRVETMKAMYDQVQGAFQLLTSGFLSGAFTGKDREK